MTCTPYCSIHLYTLIHRLPGPTEAIFLSDDRVSCVILSSAIVIPPSMLDPPAKAACPPPLTANGHCVKRDSRTAVETCCALLGLKIQAGSTVACCAAQYEPVKALYSVLPSESTLPLPKVIFKALHYVCQYFEHSAGTFSTCLQL